MSETITPNIPGNIKERAAKADEMIRALGNPQAPAPAQGGSEGAGSEAPVQEVPPTEAGGAGTQPTPTQAAPPVDGPPAPPAAPSELEDLRAQLKKLDQELRTWRGRYEAELPRERETRQALEARVQELQAEIGPKRDDAPGYTAPSQEELDTYGKDLFDIAERLIMPKVASMLADAEKRLVSKIESVTYDVGATKQEVAKTAFDRFKDRLTERVPNWTEIDSSAGFTEWLDEVDPLYAVPRRNGLTASVQAHNDEVTARFFTAYLNQQGAGGSRGTTAAAPAPVVGTEPSAAAPQPASGPKLEDFAAPGKPTSSQASDPAQPGPKIWKVSEIQDFYREVGRGAYRDRGEEKTRIEREIATAQKEGRTVYSP
jgi:hypothetical protein